MHFEREVDMRIPQQFSMVVSTLQRLYEEYEVVFLLENSRKHHVRIQQPQILLLSSFSNYWIIEKWNWRSWIILKWKVVSHCSSLKCHWWISVWFLQKCYSSCMHGFYYTERVSWVEWSCLVSKPLRFWSKLWSSFLIKVRLNGTE